MPGAPLLAGLADRFGAGIISADGSLDRAGLAAIAFKDDESRRRPQRDRPPGRAGRDPPAHRRRGGTDHVVVLDTPLLTVIDGLDVRRR